jgi:hypothetical protein
LIEQGHNPELTWQNHDSPLAKEISWWLRIPALVYVAKFVLKLMVFSISSFCAIAADVGRPPDQPMALTYFQRPRTLDGWQVKPT